MTTITEQSNKDEIITSALEVIDTQQFKLNTLTQQLKILWAALAVLVALQVL